MVPMEMKCLKSLEDFRNKIRRWEADECDCKLCQVFVSNLGYVNLVWLWDISLTIRIRNTVWFQVLGKTCYVGICLLRVGMGDCSWVWNRYRVNNDGNRAMPIMSLWCLYCWLYAYFTISSCVSFVGFQRLFRHAPLEFKFVWLVQIVYLL